MSDDTAAQLAKWEEWASRLEGNIADMARLRRSSWNYLMGSIVLGAIVWRFHHFAGGALVTLGIVVWATALYIPSMRIWYYQNELTRARHEIAQLREPEPHAAGAEG